MEIRGACAGCGRVIPEVELQEPRIPCADCGSTARNLFVEAHVVVEAKTSIGSKAKSPDEKKPFMETIGGSFPRGDRPGSWVEKTQVIDRRNNRYAKRVVDEETGEVLRNVDHPLTEHRDRGSAARKKSDPS